MFAFILECFKHLKWLLPKNVDGLKYYSYGSFQKEIEKNKRRPLKFQNVFINFFSFLENLNKIIKEIIDFYLFGCLFGQYMTLEEFEDSD